MKPRATPTDAALDAELLRLRERVARDANRAFALLLPLQWPAMMVLAYFLTPRTWIGAQADVHLHLLAAAVLGGLAVLYPLWRLRRAPTSRSSHLSVVLGQTTLITLWIHLSGGRIEAHFLVFASLAFFGLYRDWKLILAASAFVAVDHLARGIFYAQSVFGSPGFDLWRVVEHALYVVLESGVLVYMAVQAQKELRQIARRTVEADQLHHEVLDCALLLAQSGEQIESTAAHALAAAARTQSGGAELENLADSLGGSADQLAGAVERLTHEVRSLGGSTREAVSAVERSTALARELRTTSGEIGRITELIADIADQGELLAVNTGIEAARAGSSGSAFRVLAEAMKSLSLQTSRATSSIDGQLRGIEERSEGIARAVEGFETVVQSLDALSRTLDESIDRQSEVTRSLRSLVDDSRQRTRSILDEFDAVSGASEETHHAARAVADAARRLRELAARETAAA
jgi:methyl-accepting chemotaxis protein